MNEEKIYKIPVSYCYGCYPSIHVQSTSAIHFTGIKHYKMWCHSLNQFVRSPVLAPAYLPYIFSFFLPMNFSHCLSHTTVSTSALKRWICLFLVGIISWLVTFSCLVFVKTSGNWYMDKESCASWICLMYCVLDLRSSTRFWFCINRLDDR